LRGQERRAESGSIEGTRGGGFPTFKKIRLIRALESIVKLHAAWLKADKAMTGRKELEMGEAMRKSWRLGEE
jgi:hypothetical protein